jgi:hypothetical protein
LIETIYWLYKLDISPYCLGKAHKNAAASQAQAGWQAKRATQHMPSAADIDTEPMEGIIIHLYTIQLWPKEIGNNHITAGQITIIAEHHKFLIVWILYPLTWSHWGEKQRERSGPVSCHAQPTDHSCQLANANFY